LIIEGDNSGGFGNEKNQQIGWNFHNDKNWHPTSKILYIGNENGGHVMKSIFTHGKFACVKFIK
jgi:hypothetical protein